LKLDRFADYLYARCGLATSSVDLITGFIRRSSAAIGAKPSRADVERYVAGMYRAGASYASLCNTINAREHYMAYLGRPIKLARPRRPHRASVPTLSEGKLAVLIASARTLRERAALALLAYTGVRNRELTELRIRDVDIAQQSIAVEHGKGSKGRVCFVAPECIEILVDYLIDRAGEPDEFLFVTLRGAHQLQTQDIRKLVRTAAHRAGIRKRVWPHLLRHSLATALLNRGASVYSIQAQLGHTFVSTTMDYYLHPSAKNLRADYQRCAPSLV
jgi:integrase/recombinase XerD